MEVELARARAELTALRSREGEITALLRQREEENQTFQRYHDERSSGDRQLREQLKRVEHVAAAASAVAAAAAGATHGPAQPSPKQACHLVIWSCVSVVALRIATQKRSTPTPQKPPLLLLNSFCSAPSHCIHTPLRIPGVRHSSQLVRGPIAPRGALSQLDGPTAGPPQPHTAVRLLFTPREGGNALVAALAAAPKGFAILPARPQGHSSLVASCTPGATDRLSCVLQDETAGFRAACAAQRPF